MTGKLRFRGFAVAFILTNLLAPAVQGSAREPGAPDPQDAAAGPKLRDKKFTLSAADRGYWAFQPVRRPDPPALKTPPASLQPIDAFLLAKLEEKGLTQNPPATPREMARRAYFDLWGLPPAPEAVEAFEKNPADEEWGRLIERLLASPHYGERWGRHWLDSVRYAESNGYERDGEKQNAWRYRDYVIQAFNDDKPYDRFVREQLAGDELAEDLDAADARNWRDSIVATGFYRLHVWDDEPDSTIVAEYDDLNDVLVATGAAFLGLTLGCARCHDHKYDPISQSDYYSMLSFLRGIDPYGRHKTGGGGRGTGKIQRPLATPGEIRKWDEEKRERIREIEERLTRTTDAEAKKRIESELKKAREAAPPFESALAVVENGPTAKATHVLHRGEAHAPREEVSPAFPSVLGLPVPALPVRPADAASSGRRRVLADWIAGPTNPLTARVMVNRIWQRHFGAGIVATPDDFGMTGRRPTHPALLDHLAAEFVAGGWKMKRMHRLIMMSRAYRMSSRADNPQARAADADNVLLWRQNLRRVEAEAIRDTMLSVSGALNPRQGGPAVFPALPREVRAAANPASFGNWKESPAEEQNRRSVYLVVKRALKIPLLETLDFSNSTSPAGVRPVTTTAPQALMMLNDAFVQAQAAALAGRLEREAGVSLEARVARAYRLVLQRRPSPSESNGAHAMVSDQRRRAASEGRADPDRIALNSFCRAMLNLNETIYVD